MFWNPFKHDTSIWKITDVVHFEPKAWIYNILRCPLLPWPNKLRGTYEVNVSLENESHKLHSAQQRDVCMQVSELYFKNC